MEQGTRACPTSSLRSHPFTLLVTGATRRAVCYGASHDVETHSAAYPQRDHDMKEHDRSDDRATSHGSGADLQRLRDCDDLQVADGFPDIRGWDVCTRDRQKLGTVHDLIVSTSEMRARYLDVEVDDSGHALVPIGTAQLDDDEDVVLVHGITSADFSLYPRFARDASIDREYERKVVDRFSRAERVRDHEFGYDEDHFDDQRIFARQRQGGHDDTEQRVTLSEEQLEIGKRQVQAGEVEVRKHVETEHVQERVPLVHDEVSLERRPLDRTERQAGASLGEDQEIRVPIMREEAVVQKQAVPREEIIIRKRLVTEQRTVEADVRREHVDIDGADRARSDASRSSNSNDRRI
jgi:uncharacterized protein (TIGR02271 family)